MKPLDEAMDDETCHPTRAAATMSDAEDDDAETCADGEENSNNPDNSDTESDRLTGSSQRRPLPKRLPALLLPALHQLKTATTTASPAPCGGDANASDPVSGHLWAILDP